MIPKISPSNGSRRSQRWKNCCQNPVRRHNRNKRRRLPSGCNADLKLMQTNKAELFNRCVDGAMTCISDQHSSDNPKPYDSVGPLLALVNRQAHVKHLHYVCDDRRRGRPSRCDHVELQNRFLRKTSHRPKP